MKKIRNFTSHNVRLIIDKNTFLDLPSEGTARMVHNSEQFETVDVCDYKVPILRSTFGPVIGLPDPEDDTLFIVPAIVHQALTGRVRNDLLMVSNAIRDEKTGKVLGCQGFTNYLKFQ